MINLTIKRSIHEKLYNYAKYGDTMDTVINRLIEEAGDISDVYPPKRGSTAIKVSEETKQKLVSLKHDESESYSDILERLFIKISD